MKILQKQKNTFKTYNRKSIVDYECQKLDICIGNSGGSTIVKWVKDIVKIYQDRK